MDFETTGLEPGNRHPVQVAVATGGLGDVDTLLWSSLVRPPVPIPAEATAVHGIGDADVADAPSFDELLPKLLELLEGRVLCAFNLPYDHDVLVCALHAAGRPDLAPPLMGLDPLVWVKVVDRYQRGKRLEDAAGRRGIQFKAHDARGDVEGTARLMPVLLRELGREGHVRKPGLDRLDAFWHWQRVAALQQEREYRTWRRSQHRDDPTMPWHVGLGVDPEALLELTPFTPSAG